MYVHDLHMRAYGRWDEIEAALAVPVTNVKTYTDKMKNLLWLEELQQVGHLAWAGLMDKSYLGGTSAARAALRFFRTLNEQCRRGAGRVYGLGS